MQQCIGCDVFICDSCTLKHRPQFFPRRNPLVFYGRNIQYIIISQVCRNLGFSDFFPCWFFSVPLLYRNCNPKQVDSSTGGAVNFCSTVKNLNVAIVLLHNFFGCIDYRTAFYSRTCKQHIVCKERIVKIVTQLLDNCIFIQRSEAILKVLLRCQHHFRTAAQCTIPATFGNCLNILFH